MKVAMLIGRMMKVANQWIFAYEIFSQILVGQLLMANVIIPQKNDVHKKGCFDCDYSRCPAYSILPANSSGTQTSVGPMCVFQTAIPLTKKRIYISFIIIHFCLFHQIDWTKKCEVCHSTEKTEQNVSNWEKSRLRKDS